MVAARWAQPEMAFKGVRSSCDTFASSRSFTLFASWTQCSHALLLVVLVRKCLDLLTPNHRLDVGEHGIRQIGL